MLKYLLGLVPSGSWIGRNTGLGGVNASSGVLLYQLNTLKGRQHTYVSSQPFFMSWGLQEQTAWFLCCLPRSDGADVLFLLLFLQKYYFFMAAGQL
jgi:hypothetical protein